MLYLSVKFCVKYLRMNFALHKLILTAAGAVCEIAAVSGRKGDFL